MGNDMQFGYSDKTQKLRERVTAFMDQNVYPAEPVFARKSPTLSMHPTQRYDAASRHQSM